MAQEEYVSFETAKLLKEKKFPQYSFRCHYVNGTMQFEDRCGFGDDDIIAPTQQTAMRWLREVYNIDVEAHADCGMLGVKVYTPVIKIYKPLAKPELLTDEDKWENRWKQKSIYLCYKDDNKNVIKAIMNFDSYEEACESAIKYCLENLKTLCGTM